MSYSDDKRQLSEFEWEKEIRKDEERINSYLNELKNFIDLPNEEELIMEKIFKNNSLIPQNSDLNISLSSNNELHEDSAFLVPDDEWRRKDGGDIYILIEQLAAQWNTVLATELPADLIITGIKITSIYGYLLARTSDILNLDEALPALRIALCKRLHSKISEQIGFLHEIAKQAPQLSHTVETHISHIQSIRNKLISLLEKIRKSNSSE
jgi:hypothetical protein